MATVLDLASLEAFSPIFVFLFVFVLFYAIFTFSKTAPISKPIAIMLSLAIALLISSNKLTSLIVANTLPWLGVFLIAAIAGLAARSIFVGGEAQPPMENAALYAGIVFLVILGGAALTIREHVTIPGDNETSADFDRDYSSSADTLFSPKVMGVILIMAIAVAAVALLTKG